MEVQRKAVIHYFKLTYQIFKKKVTKNWTNIQGQVVNPQHQTLQGQPVTTVPDACYTKILNCYWIGHLEFEFEKKCFPIFRGIMEDMHMKL